MPAGQTAQEEEATEAEIVPAAHAAQSMTWSCMATTVAASAKYVPAGQFKQVVATEDPRVEEYMPEGQVMQADAETCDE